MALGKIPASISPSPSIKASGAPINSGGLRNINSDLKGGISEFTNFISASVDPGKPITAELLDKAIKNAGDSIPPSLGEALASFAPTETTQKDSTADAKARQATAETHAKFAFNLPGQSNQEKTQNQDFLKNMSGNDWMNSGASLS